MVFERAERFPTPEEYLPECPVPRSAYGFSKLTGEVYCRAAHEEHGLPYTICRPFNAYGPGELPDAEPGIAHAVPDLIRKSLRGQRPLQIFGSGEQTRTLTHVHDIADGIVAAMSSPAGLGEDFNISASRELTVSEIAGIVWEACGRDPHELQLEHLPSFAVDVQRRWPSVEKARRLLGWEARIGVHDGIASTVSWLREQIDSGAGAESAASASAAAGPPRPPRVPRAPARPSPPRGAARRESPPLPRRRTPPRPPRRRA
jgi:nucleoside-diphosphate-sugar epimerase